MRTRESITQLKLSFVYNWDGTGRRSEERNWGRREASGGGKEKSDMVWCPEHLYTFTFGNTSTFG